MNICVDGRNMDAPEKTVAISLLREKGKNIPGMCKIPSLEPYGACRLCLIEVNGRLTTACSYFPKEKDSILTSGKDIVALRRSALELMLSDHYGDCIAPCKKGCPANSDVQGYLALIAMGKYHDAVRLMKERYVLPAVLGRVCPAFCEDECRRNLVEEPLAIRQMKRFAADRDLESGPWMPEIPPSSGKKVAIIGGGPAGLSCAYYTRIRGHDVTIFEAMPKLGGMLRYGIPSNRLPKDVLGKDIDTIIGTGVKVITNCVLGKDITLNHLLDEYDAVFLGIGAWVGRTMGVEGEHLPGVVQGIEFLRKINSGERIEPGRNVMVVGGGNTAMDVARSARRLGANVTLVYRRSREEMPANKREVAEAEEEGVKFLFLTNPVRVVGNGRVERIELIRMKLGPPDESKRRSPISIAGSNFLMDIDCVIPAVGQTGDGKLLDSIGVSNDRGQASYDKLTFETNIPRVFSGGDLVLGPSTAIESIATGRRAASLMHTLVTGKRASIKTALNQPWTYEDEISIDKDMKEVLFDMRPYCHWKDATREDYKHVAKSPRAQVSHREASERVRDFTEVEPSLKEADVSRESERCMSCGCMDGFECLLREYSTIYQANQHTFLGEIGRQPIDESHEFVAFDSNKCILCGKCVNLTQEMTGEGLLDYVYRGFTARISPPIGTKLGDATGDFVGAFIDVCPTGAFSEKLPFAKPGPWDSKRTGTVCNQCGMGCEVDIEAYADMPIRMSGRKGSWNYGITCDKVRFQRTWAERVTRPSKRVDNGFVDIDHQEAKAIVRQHMGDLAIVLTPETTMEEARGIKSLANSIGATLCGIYDEGRSTAKYEDILNSKRIKVGVNLKEYPMLRTLLHMAKKGGGEVVTHNYDLAILQAPAEPENVPTIILHHGTNEVGLIELGIQKVVPARNYLVIGPLDRKLDGFTMVLGNSEYADLMLPSPAWIERKGTIMNPEGEKLLLTKALDGEDLIELVGTYVGAESARVATVQQKEKRLA